jgi:hypothetical protein
MSYFVCGFNNDTECSNNLAKILDEIIPHYIRETGYRIEDRVTALTVYGNKKVIPDFVVRNHETGSWMAVIGTPLFRLISVQEEQAFLAEYLNNPFESLRDTIDGNFAVLAYDGERDKFIAATDFNNTTPIFYTITTDGVLFSSHELILARLLHSEIDPLGFSQLVHLGVTWNSYTRFRNIYKLLPCQVAIVDNRKELHTECYWRPQDETIWSGDFEANIKKWGPLLEESVWKFYEMSDCKPVLSDFTAGEDARLILAQCHALGIPYRANVTGSADSPDVMIAKKAAKKVGFELLERQQQWINEKQLLTEATRSNLESDAYQGFTTLCSELATNNASPLDDYSIVKYCGAPGGEAFRGSYYLRGKALFPAKKSRLDHRFFTRMKYLLDYHPGLLKYSGEDFLDAVYKMVTDSLEDVKEFPIGTQIDHLLRVYQTCFLGLKYKNPLYLPFATNKMTRSIYCLSPRYKRGGKLTKAYTEILFPELALVKTQNGVPTIRKTVLRIPLFMPEYISVIKKISRGAISRFIKVKQPKQWYYREDLNAYIFTTLLNNPPYCNWFTSSATMLTGYLYNPGVVESILSQAKIGSCKNLPVLERIVSQELALRWVYREGSS